MIPGRCSGSQGHNCREIQKCEDWKVLFGSGRSSLVTLVILFIFNQYLLNAYKTAGVVLRYGGVSVNNLIPVKGTLHNK